jgi:signal transduction histidine kinase/ligand-binding sensor domain-containing protein
VGTKRARSQAMDNASAFYYSVRFLRICVVSAVLCAAGRAQDAQPTLAQFEHKAWTIRDGAPAYVAAIAQTTDGFLWLGTSTGLYRFDGVRFEKFSGPPGQSLPSTNISALVGLPDGTLWIGYRFGGASLLTPNRVANYGEREGLPGGTVWRFARDSTGVIWAATNRGLARLEGRRWTRISAESGMSGTRAMSVFADQRGNLWVGADSGLFMLPRSARRFELRQRTSVPMEAGSGDGGNRRVDSPREIVDVDEAPDGSIWAFVVRRGLTRLSDAGGGALASPDFGRKETARILIDDGANAWISIDGGVGRVPLSQRGGTTAAQGLSRAQGLSGGSVFDLFEDRENNLWVGTDGGLDRFRRTKLRPVPLPTPFILPVMTAGGDSSVLLASWSNPPVRVGIDNRVRAVALPHDSLQCAYRDRHGVVWLGGASGLWRLDGSTFVRVELPADAAGQELQGIALDTANRLWISIVRRGVYRRTGRVWTKVAFQSDPAIFILSDSSGRTWMGHTENRLVLVDGDNSRTFTTADGLRVGNVLAIHVRGERVWIGGERGLEHFAHGRFVPITGADGDTFRGTSGIVETASGELWLNGADGVTRIGAEEVRNALRDTTYRVRFERLDFHDGLDGVPSQIRPLPTAIEGSDGRLWFVTGTAAMWLDPRSLLRNRLPPPVQILSLRAGDSTYSSVGAQTLPTGTAALQIRYTALSLSVPEHVHFRYQLAGNDTGWMDVGTRRDAYYTNLRPGSYRFRVVASNEDGVWNDAGAAMNIVIPPTFVQTRWFLALCVLAAALATWMLYRLRVRSVATAMRSRFDATLAERIRIAGELHDTLLQGFTGITLHLQSVQRMVSSRPAEAATTLSRVLAQADAAIRDARCMVSDMRTHELDESDLPSALTTAARNAVADTSIEMRISIVGEPHRLERSIELAVFRIAREAIANAVKHANPRHLEIVLSYELRDLRLRVWDDGRGFSPFDADAAPNGGHWGIVGMRERARSLRGVLEIGGTPTGGTIVSLSLPIVKAHGHDAGRALASGSESVSLPSSPKSTDNGSMQPR